MRTENIVCVCMCVWPPAAVHCTFYHVGSSAVYIASGSVFRFRASLPFRTILNFPRSRHIHIHIIYEYRLLYVILLCTAILKAFPLVSVHKIKLISCRWKWITHTHCSSVATGTKWAVANCNPHTLNRPQIISSFFATLFHIFGSNYSSISSVVV